MQKTIVYLIGGALMAGLVTAQQDAGSVEDVLRQLGEAPQTEAAAAEEPAERRGWFGRRRDRTAEREEAEAMPVAREPAAANAGAGEAPVMQFDDPESDVDVPAVLDASRALYVGGEFERAQRGFELVLRQEPENKLATLYMRRIKERAHRKVQVDGIQAVDDAWDGRMVLRTYPVSGEGQRKMDLSDQEEPLCVIHKFPEVDFPEGAAAVYQPAAGNLHVRNTREHLAVLEEILDAMDVSNHRGDIDQVEIEAKFMEVAAGTLQQLGFDWNLGYNYRPGMGVEVPENQGLFSSALRPVSYNQFGQPDGTRLPFDNQTEWAAGREAQRRDTPVGEWTTFRFDETFSTDAATMEVNWNNQRGREVDVLISALSQASGTDVLSSPRVVTRSGETARIRVGQLHYFPEVYEVGADGGTILHVKYEDFVETLLGVELEVTPRVDAGQITMRLNPTIRDLAGWRNYHIAAPNSSYNHYQAYVRMQFFHDDPIQARLPIFNTRRIDTEVTIADGSTIGMGGLINEKTEAFKDKVPVLGSVPLIGRLFRSEGERTVKKNLLMFVSARTVDPSGRINTARSFADDTSPAAAPSGRSLFF